MASQDHDSQLTAGDEADLAQAFKDIARGERTAAAMEAHLTALERKIDELLAQADQNQQSVDEVAAEEAAGSKEEGTKENGEKSSSS